MRFAPGSIHALEEELCKAGMTENVARMFPVPDHQARQGLAGLNQSCFSEPDPFWSKGQHVFAAQWA